MPNDDNFLSFPNKRKPFIHVSSCLHGDGRPTVQAHSLIGSDSVKSNSSSNTQEESISRCNTGLVMREAELFTIFTDFIFTTTQVFLKTGPHFR